jgi:radical SAM superfamily enzyme YgiQ (UPF0313 family)
MRVLLLNPPGPEGVGYIREGRCEQKLSSYAYRMVPISLPSIAGLLRERGHEVKIIDAISPRVKAGDLPRDVRAFDPGLVVVSLSTPTYDSDVAFVTELRGWTSAHLTAIGVHVTALPEATLKESRLSSVIKGEPEWTAADLADCLAAGRPLASVKGIVFRETQSIITNEERGFTGDLDELPPPARDLLPEEDYFLPIFNRPYTLVQPTRGCPHHCTYCTAPSYDGKKLRQRDPKKVVDEMESIVRRGVVHDITMWSDTFTLDKKFVLEFCRELSARKLDVRWMCNSRVDSIDGEMAVAMKASGCVGISFGVESGVQEILDRVKKGTTVEQGRVAIRTVKAAGISTLTHFILGLPGETKETIRQTVAYAKEIDPDWAQFYCANPLPGTALRAEVEKAGHLKVVPWQSLEFNVPQYSTPTLSTNTLRFERARAYAEFYLRPSAAKRVLAKLNPGELKLFATQITDVARTWVLSV